MSKNRPRQRWESPADLENEKEAAKKIEAETGLVFIKNPDSYRADFLVFNMPLAQTMNAYKKPWDEIPEPFAWAEVKCRTNGPDAFETYMISFEKVMFTIQWAAWSGTRPLLFVAFNEGTIKWINLKLATKKVTWGGRTVNPKDEQDVEPVALIPMSEFRTLEELKLELEFLF